MTDGYTPSLPPDIMDLAQLIHRLRNKSYVTRAELETIKRAKLRIAFWACRNEKLPVTRENLAFVMGTDAGEIITAYDQYLENQVAEGKSGKEKKDGKEFWDGV
jgi:hypothetical protein